MGDMTLAFGSTVACLIFMTPYVLWDGIPEIKTGFWPCLLFVGAINAITTPLMIRALSISEVSKVSPILGFSPVFLLFTSIFLLGEIPTIYGGIGVIIIVAGTIYLNRDPGQRLSFQALLGDKGQKYVLLITLMWSFSSIYFKVGMQASSPAFFVFAMRAMMAICFAYVVLSKERREDLIKHMPSILVLGMLVAIVSITQWTAAALGVVVYVLCIKRMSSLFTVVFGRIFFGEKNIGRKLIASTVILIGVAFIIIAG